MTVCRESDLHKRFPGVFPRFWRNAESELLVVDRADLGPQSDYSVLEIPKIERETTSRSNSTENGDGEIEPPSKRPTTIDSLQTAISVYVPSAKAHSLRLSPTMLALKDSMHRTEAITGFVVTSLGGVLHVSQPPTLEELQLYCDVLAIYDQHKLHIGDFIGTFAHALNTIYQAHKQSSHLQVLDSLFESVWVHSRSLVCLSFLAPLLSKCADHKRLLKRIGNLILLNGDLFMDFTHFPSSSLKLSETLKQCPDLLLPDVYHPYLQDPEDVEAALDSPNPDFFHRGVCTIGGEQIKMLDEIDASFFVPLHLMSISSTYTNKQGKVSTKRQLAHKSLLVKHWPYFTNLINSGLSESRTRTVELPIPIRAINTAVGLLYGYPCNEREDVGPMSRTALCCMALCSASSLDSSATTT